MAGPWILLLAPLIASSARVESSLLSLREQPNGAQPWFCHDLDCPQYVSVKNITDLELSPVELRRYAAGNWVSTVVLDVKSYEGAVAKGFWRLFRYISGENEQEQKVEMTAPVRVKVLPGQGPACESNFTISFFIPSEFQADPPKPTNPDVAVTASAAMDVYVWGFGGWATGNKYVSHASDLVQQLTDGGYKVEEDFFYTAGYDSPFRVLNRHNEVWIPAAQAPTSMAS